MARATVPARPAAATGGGGGWVDVLLDAALSSDPDGSLLDYVWELDGELVARFRAERRGRRGVAGPVPLGPGAT